MPIFIGVTEDRGGPKSGQGKLADLDALGLGAMDLSAQGQPIRVGLKDMPP